MTTEEPEIWALRDYYDLLEVSRGASDAEVQDAFRFQSKVWHPDRFQGESAEIRSRVQARQQAINEANATLRDATRRARYDRSLTPAAEEIQVFPLPEQNHWQVWKRMAGWMKEEDVGRPFDRTMAYKAGDRLERSQRPTEREMPYMLTAWETAIADGFDPHEEDE